MSLLYLKIYMGYLWDIYKSDFFSTYNTRLDLMVSAYGFNFKSYGFTKWLNWLRSYYFAHRSTCFILWFYMFRSSGFILFTCLDPVVSSYGFNILNLIATPNGFTSLDHIILLKDVIISSYGFICLDPLVLFYGSTSLDHMVS